MYSLRFFTFFLLVIFFAGCQQHEDSGNIGAEDKLDKEPARETQPRSDNEPEVTETDMMSKQYKNIEDLVIANQFTEALSLCDELIEKVGHNAFLLAHKSIIYSGLVNTTEEKKKIEEYTKQATNYANEALSLDDKSKWSHLAMALAYAKNANLANFTEKAKYSKLSNEHCRKVLAIDPEEPVTNFILGRFYYEIADLNGAAALMAKPILGKKVIEEASFDLALVHLKKSSAQRPNRFMYVYFTGMAYSKLNNETEALKYFKKAKVLKPESGEEQELYAELDKHIRKTS